MEKFLAQLYLENDGTVSLWMDKVELGASGRTLEEARKNLSKDPLKYAKEYGKASDKKRMLPWVERTLEIGNSEKLAALIECKVEG